MSEEAKVSKGTGRRPRPRGGLGRGLGALIPTAEDELAQASSCVLWTFCFRIWLVRTREP